MQLPRGLTKEELGHIRKSPASNQQGPIRRQGPAARTTELSLIPRPEEDAVELQEPPRRRVTESGVTPTRRNSRALSQAAASSHSHEPSKAVPVRVRVEGSQHFRRGHALRLRAPAARSPGCRSSAQLVPGTTVCTSNHSSNLVTGTVSSETKCASGAAASCAGNIDSTELLAPAFAATRKVSSPDRSLKPQAMGIPLRIPSRIGGKRGENACDPGSKDLMSPSNPKRRHCRANPPSLAPTSRMTSGHS